MIGGYLVGLFMAALTLYTGYRQIKKRGGYKDPTSEEMRKINKIQEQWEKDHA